MSNPIVWTTETSTTGTECQWCESFGQPVAPAVTLLTCGEQDCRGVWLCADCAATPVQHCQVCTW